MKRYHRYIALILGLFLMFSTCVPIKADNGQYMQNIYLRVNEDYLEKNKDYSSKSKIEINESLSLLLQRLQYNLEEGQVITRATAVVSIASNNSVYITSVMGDLFISHGLRKTLIGSMLGELVINNETYMLSVSVTHNVDMSGSKAVVAIGNNVEGVENTEYYEFGSQAKGFAEAYENLHNMLEAQQENEIDSPAADFDEELDLNRDIDSGVYLKRCKNYSSSSGRLHAFAFYAQKETGESDMAKLYGKGGGNASNALTYIKSSVHPTANNCYLTGYEIRLYSYTSGAYVCIMNPNATTQYNNVTFQLPYTLTLNGSVQTVSVTLTISSYVGSYLSNSYSSQGGAKWKYTRLLGVGGLASGNITSSNLSESTFPLYSGTPKAIAARAFITYDPDVTTYQNVTVYGIGYATFGYLYTDASGYESNTTWTHSLNSGNYTVKFVAQ